MENSSVPPGFRFHPTDEELVGYYLTRKVSSLKIDLDVIMDIDLYRIEPWDIQDRCKLYEEQKEWYFFSYKDRKYPTGTRTNRATASGFWKATGRDKAVLSKEKLIGMRKTLVFYRGRAPNGKKTDWIIHEYRLQTSEHEIPQEEGWVVCRAFKKPTPYHKHGFEYWNDPMISYARSDFRHPPLTDPTTSALAHNNNNNNNNSLDLLNQQTTATSFNHPPPLNDGNSFMELRNLESSSVSMGLDREFSKSGDKDEYWKGFDKVIEPSWVQPNMALLISSDSDGFAAADHQTHMSHVLECFPADL